MTESILLTSVFRTLMTVKNEGDSEHGGVRVNYSEVHWLPRRCQKSRGAGLCEIYCQE